jgi:putative endonuclease
VRAAPTAALSRLVAYRPAAGKVTPLEARLSTAELGVLGEELAARDLRRRGWLLMGRNVAADEAELDIVAIDGETLVVIEVKAGWCPAGSETSKWSKGRPGDRVTKTGIARRLRAAKRLAQGTGLYRQRVDVMEVIAGRGPVAEVCHRADVASQGRHSS